MSLPEGRGLTCAPCPAQPGSGLQSKHQEMDWVPSFSSEVLGGSHVEGDASTKLSQVTPGF